MNVPVRSTLPSLTASGVWAVTPKVINQDTVVASSLHDGSDLNTVVRIVNLSEKPRKFRKGDLITEAVSVEICEDDSCEVGVGSFHNEEVDPLNSANTFSDFDFDAKSRFMEIQKSKDDTEHLESMLKNIGQSLSEQQRKDVVEFLKKNSDVLAKSEFDLGRTGLVKHIIDTGGNKPFKQQLRRHLMAHLPVIDEHVDKMLQNDIIEPSSSPWASNVVLVRKADNSLRFCVDYRKLNLLSVKDSYPLPRIDTSFDALGEAKFFSTLDLQSAY